MQVFLQRTSDVLDVWPVELRRGCFDWAASAAKAGPLSTGHSTLDRQAGEKIRVLEMVSTSFAAHCTVMLILATFQLIS